MSAPTAWPAGSPGGAGGDGGGAPFLFDGANARAEKRAPRRARKKVVPELPRSRLRQATTTPELYPMWLLSVPQVLVMPQVLPHQELLRLGMLVRYDASRHAGRVIFVSHQWTGHGHPDPGGDHWQCLRSVVSRMIGGMMPRVGSHHKDQKAFKHNFFVEPTEMRDALPFMFVWIDYASMPQPSAGPMPEISYSEGETAATSVGEWKGSFLNFIRSDAIVPPSSPAKSSKVIGTFSNYSDHRKQSAKNFQKDDSVACADHRHSLSFQTPSDKPKDEESEDDDGPGNIPNIVDVPDRSRVQELLSEATESIPSYIERSTLMLVLVPPSQHYDREGEFVTYSSWRGRGWCRFEFLAATLTRERVRIMAVFGPESSAHFMSTTDALILPPGTGSFTCCARKHDFGNGADSEPCDKLKIAVVLDTMLTHKVNALFATGTPEALFEARYFVAARHKLMRGLDDEVRKVRRVLRKLDEAGAEHLGVLELVNMRRQESPSFNVPKGNQVAFFRDPSGALQTVLRWRIDSDEKPWVKATGAPLAFWAALADDHAALAHLCQEERPSRTRKLLKTRTTQAHPHLGMPKGMVPLHVAAGAGVSREVVEVLLDHGGKGYERIQTQGLHWDFVTLCAVMGSAHLIDFWAERFPEWNWAKKDRLFGAPYITFSANQGGQGRLACSLALKAAGTKIDSIAESGYNVLHYAACNPDADADLARGLLRMAGKDKGALLTQRIVPRSLKWRLIYRRGMFRSQGSTPLHMAAMDGNIDVIQIFLEAGADPAIRNKQGRTPRELAQKCFGDELPRVLDQALGHEGSAPRPPPKHDVDIESTVAGTQGESESVSREPSPVIPLKPEEKHKLEASLGHPQQLKC